MEILIGRVWFTGWGLGTGSSEGAWKIWQDDKAVRKQGGVGKAGFALRALAAINWQMGK